MNAAGKLKMARQDSDEMTVVIFASTDTIDLPHDIRTKLDDLNHPEEEQRQQIRKNVCLNAHLNLSSLLFCFLYISAVVNRK